MLISVITVCLNAAATIEETAESLLAQCYTSFEWLVIDGGSTDDTLGIVGRYKMLNPKVILAQGSSIYEAMNIGIDTAEGAVAGFLNADDRYVKCNTLQTIADAFNQSSADCIYGDLVVYSPRFNRIIRYWRAGEYVQGSFKDGWMAPHPTFYVKSAILRHHRFDSHLRIAADLKQQLMMFERFQVTWCYVPVTLVEMKSGGVSNRSFVSMFSNMCEAARILHPESILLQIRYMIRVVRCRFPQIYWHAFALLLIKG